MGMQDAILTKADQCQYSLIVEDMKGQALAKKLTKSQTNSRCIASQLRRTCEGAHTHSNHRHANLFGGVAKFVQVYPPALCEAICCGLKEQVDLDRRGQFSLLELNAQDLKEACGNMHAPVTKWLGNLSFQEEIHPTVCEDNDAKLMQAWDDVTGKELDAQKVALARQEDVDCIHNTNLYTKVPRSKAKSQGAKVITVRWIDINKGDALNPKYRSRLVAREVKKDLRIDLFSATPPLEAMKMLLPL